MESLIHQTDVNGHRKQLSTLIWSEVTMMESPMTRNCHVGFGERDEETHQSQDWEVRFVPTPSSPLLANIALHGMEGIIKSISKKAYFVRYADDFIVLHNDLEIIKRCKQALEIWLNNIGLALKPSKTRITNTLNEHEGNSGFDFLGFNIRQYQMSKYRSGKRGKGFKTLIKPSKDSLKRHLDKISKIIKRGKALPTYAIINQLNPVIRGWTNYYERKSHVRFGRPARMSPFWTEFDISSLGRRNRYLDW